MKKPNLPFDPDKATIASNIVRALANPGRMDIIKFINEKGTTTVAPIYCNLKMNQSICSQQLKILRDSNIVFTERKGKEIIYSLNYERIEFINEIIQGL